MCHVLCAVLAGDVSIDDWNQASIDCYCLMELLDRSRMGLLGCG